MANSLKAGFFCALAVFAVGFVFGTLRVFLVEPAFGPALAVAIELPLMLGISWLVARAVFRRVPVRRLSWQRLAASVTALLVLLVLETGLGLLFGQSLGAQAQAYLTPRGVLTGLGQLAFALIVFSA